MMVAVSLVIVLLCGTLVGAVEIASRYRDAPLRTLLSAPGIGYVLLNTAVAAAAYAVIRAMDWRFGVPETAPPVQVQTIQVLVAGLGSAVLLRSALFTVSQAGHDVQIGPAAVLDALKKVV